MNALVREQLDNLQLQFPGKSSLTLDEYATLYGITRRYASRHLKRRQIPYTKEGKGIYINITDLATYKAKCKVKHTNELAISVNEEMKRRRGFNQMAEKRFIEK